MNEWRTGGRGLVASAVLLLAGLAGITWMTVAGRAAPFGGAISLTTAFIASGLFLLAYELVIRPESTAGIDRRLSVAAEANRLGLKECVEDSSLYDLSDALCESRRLTVVLNDGRTWLSVHRDRLRKRLQDPAKETILFLIHPDSDMLGVLARKGSVDPDVLRGKIQESLTLIAEISSPSSKIEVLGHFLFNPHTLVLTDKQAITVPYFTSRGGRTVPLFVFEDIGEDCYYRQLVADMEGLRKDSRLLVEREDRPLKMIQGGTAV